MGRWRAWAIETKAVEAAEEFLRRGSTGSAEDGLPWAVIWLNDEMEGGALFLPLDKRARSTEAGYWLSKQAMAQGLASCAMRVMLEHGIEAIRLNRVAHQPAVGIDASIAVARRAWSPPNDALRVER